MPKGTTIKMRIEQLAEVVPQTIDSIGSTETDPKELWAKLAADRDVRYVCGQLGFNPARPSHMAKAFKLVCQALTPRSNQRWNSYSLTQLLMNFLRVREQRPDATDRDLYAALAKKPLYNKYEPQTLGRAVRNALDPRQNPLLRDALAMMPKAVALMNARRKRSPLPDWRTLPSHFFDLLTSN